MNLLQQTLLDRWLGDRDELCAVGDDYQSIYAFTGASPEHLLAMPRRFPHAAVVRLEENYRSTPEILEFANRLVPQLGGAEKVLRATRPAGPEPVLAPFDGAISKPASSSSTSASCTRGHALRGHGDPVPHERAARPTTRRR